MFKMKKIQGAFIRLRAENHGCKSVDVYQKRDFATTLSWRKCELSALRRDVALRAEGGPRRRKAAAGFQGITAVKPWGSILLFCFVMFCVAPGCSSFVAQTSQQVEIKRVVDGDTVELKDGKFARYIGIDCPELERKTSSGWVEVHDPFALEAKKANEELVSRHPVVFEFDVCKLDKYNRLLVYCYVEIEGRKVLVQSELLKRGLAYLYTFPPNVKYTDILVESFNDAKQHKRGVWSLDLDINSKDARQFVGQRKAVTGRVKSVFSTPKTVCLKLDGLVAVIFDKDVDTFLKKHLDPAAAYQEKTIRVFGLIKKYKGRFEIIVSHPSQIDVLEG